MADLSATDTHEHDVLVIGAGGAGLRAAIEAQEQGLDTGVVCKSLLGKAHTVMAEGGMAAALANADERDSWKFHFRDTMRGGKFLNQWRMAEHHAKQAPDRARELEQWGAVFDRTEDGLIDQRDFGGHRYPRLAHVGDRTGLELIRSLQDYGIHQDIDVYMECKVLDLLKDGDRVSGAVGLWRESGRFCVFDADAVVMATGGGGKAWRVTSNSWEYTGDGFAMALDAGADLMDMEFNQFHPTGMVWPPSVHGTLVTEGVRGEGGVLLNSEGERFMFDYVPERFAPETADTPEEGQAWVEGDDDARRPPELLTRDVVARAILNEVSEGRGSPHGGAFLDIASQRPDEYIKKKLPSMHEQFIELAEVDITNDPMEVGPTLHYFMGGIRVDPDTQASTVPGLFACGEAAAGLHGANRLGGNSLSDLMVFGRLAGQGVADYVQELSETPEVHDDQVGEIVDDAKAFLEREEGENPFMIHEDLQDLMQECVGILRTEDELEEALEGLEDLKGRLDNAKAHPTSQFNAGWHKALDLQSLIEMAQAVASAALEREESRGAHTRLDFEGEREEWGEVNILVRKEDGELVIDHFDRPEPPEELAEIGYASLEELEQGDV